MKKIIALDPYREYRELPLPENIQNQIIESLICEELIGYEKTFLLNGINCVKNSHISSADIDNATNQIESAEGLLENIKIDLKHNSNLDYLAQNTPAMKKNLLLELDCLCAHRHKIWDKLDESVKTYLPEMQEDVSDLINMFNHVYFLKYQKKPISETFLSEIDTLSQSVTSKIVFLLEEVFVRSALKQNYSTLITHVRNVRLYETWLNELNKQAQDIHNNHDPDSFGYTLAVKNLLGSTKKAFFINHYQSTPLKSLGLIHQLFQYIKDNEIVVPIKDIDLLATQILLKCDQAKSQCTELEASLKSYSFKFAAAAWGCSLFTSNPYYQSGHTTFKLFNQLSETPQQHTIPVLSTHMTQAYVNGFSIASGISSFALDIFRYRLMGLSYSMIQTLSQIITSDLDSFIKTHRFLGQDEHKALSHLHKFEWMVGIGVYAGINAALGRRSLAELGFSCGEYISGSLLRAIGGYVVDTAYFARSTEPAEVIKEHPTFPIMHSLYQSFGFATGLRLFPSIAQKGLALLFRQPFYRDYQSWKSNEDVLGDSDINSCSPPSFYCRSQARDELQVTRSTSARHIRKQYRKLVEQCHRNKAYYPYKAPAENQFNQTGNTTALVPTYYSFDPTAIQRNASPFIRMNNNYVPLLQRRTICFNTTTTEKEVLLHRLTKARDILLDKV